MFLKLSDDRTHSIINFSITALSKMSFNIMKLSIAIKMCHLASKTYSILTLNTNANCHFMLSDIRPNGIRVSVVASLKYF
jgi:hypothetical protein